MFIRVKAAWVLRDEEVFERLVLAASCRSVRDQKMIYWMGVFFCLKTRFSEFGFMISGASEDCGFSVDSQIVSLSSLIAETRV